MKLDLTNVELGTLLKALEMASSRKISMAKWVKYGAKHDRAAERMLNLHEKISREIDNDLRISRRAA